MQDKVDNTIRQYGLVHRGDTVVVGVSGGADSVALLTVLKRLSQYRGFSVCAAHLNHMIRGESADRDQRFVEELCEFYGVPLLAERANIPAIAQERSQTLETAGRLVRYEFLERTRKHFGAQLVAVAHHMDDQAESVLLHLTRGSGLSGLCGMQYKRDNIIRPLLSVRRSEIEDFLNTEGIAYCVDATNFETGGTRNRIRLDVVPYIQQNINPAIVPTLCSTAELLSRDEAYLMQEAEQALEAAREQGGYLRKQLAALPLSIQARAIRAALRDAGAVTDIERVHVEQVLGFLSARTGARLVLPHVEAWISYELIYFGVSLQAPEFELKLNLPGRTETPLGVFTAEWVEPGELVKNLEIACMDASCLPEEITVRTRRRGDRFYPFGAPGRRKLKDYFIDKKVPREARILPMLCSGQEVLFLPGFGISETVRVTEATQRMLKVTYCDIKFYKRLREGEDG